MVFGAITPFFVMYSLICGSYPFRDTTNPWADAPFDAAQRMSLWPYLATVGVATVLSRVSKTHTPMGGFFFGFLAAPIAFIMLALIGILLRAV